jgi:hypothetical protein
MEFRMLDTPSFDEPAAPAAPATKLDRRGGYDERAIARACIRRWDDVVKHWLFDWKGKPTADVRRLNPSNKAIDHNFGRRYGELDTSPRLVEFSGPYPFEDGREKLGSLVCRGNGARGDSLVDLVVYLSGGCDRRAAGEFAAILSRK